MSAMEMEVTEASGGERSYGERRAEAAEVAGGEVRGARQVGQEELGAEEEGIGVGRGAGEVKEEVGYLRLVAVDGRGALYEAEAGSGGGRVALFGDGSPRLGTAGDDAEERRLVIPSLIRSSSTAAFGWAASREIEDVESDGPNPPRVLVDEGRVVRCGSGLRAEEEAAD